MIRHAGADLRLPRMLSAKDGPSGFFFFFFLFFFLFAGGGLPLKSLDTCVDIDRESGAPDNSPQSHFSATMRP